MNRIFILFALIIFVGCVEAKDLTQDLYTTNQALNTAYHQAISKLDKNAQATLRQEQRNWIKKRNQACNTQHIKATGKAWLQAIAKDPTQTRCVIRLTRERTVKLKAGLKNKTAAIAVKKKYPPYPEVWGYMLPIPSKDSRYSGIRLYKMKNGDYFFTYITYRKGIRRDDGTCCKDYKLNFRGKYFFSKEYHTIAENKYNSVSEKYRNYKIKVTPPKPIIFSDGSSISLGGPGSFNCYSPFSVHLVRKDRNGRIVERKSLVYLLDTPDKRVLKPSCGNPEGAVVTLNVIGVSYLTFIKLADDTFLAYNHRENFILRFNKELKTKFPLNDRLFLIDTAVIEKIKQKAKQIELDKGALAYYQYINDEVRNYVLEIKRRNHYGR